MWGAVDGLSCIQFETHLLLMAFCCFDQLVEIPKCHLLCLREPIFIKCFFPPGADSPVVKMAGVSAQPRHDTSAVSILVANFVAVAASVKNTEITVRKGV